MQAADLSRMAMQTGSTSRADLQPSPLDPTWIIEGNPTARSLSLAQAGDGRLSCGLWDCTPGKFKFIYYCDEIVHILEGEVTVQEPGKQYTLRAGDIAFFPQGLTTYWTVHAYVKKFCIFRDVERGLLRRIGSKMKGLVRSLLGRGK